MKQTPEIVIPSMKINSCDVCPFLRESPDFFDEKIKRSCGHRDRSSWDDMNEYHFEVINGTEIWINCPLPDAVSNDEQSKHDLFSDSCPNCGNPLRTKELWEGGGVECSSNCGYWFCF